MAERGYWNRAGRRSGGDKPMRIIFAPRQWRCICGQANCAKRFACPCCGNDMLPLAQNPGCEDCRAIIELHLAGKI